MGHGAWDMGYETWGKACHAEAVGGAGKPDPGEGGYDGQL